MIFKIFFLKKLKFVLQIQKMEKAIDPERIRRDGMKAYEDFDKNRTLVFAYKDGTHDTKIVHIMALIENLQSENNMLWDHLEKTQRKNERLSYDLDNLIKKQNKI